MAEEKVICSVEGNEHVPVIFNARFPVVNSKATRARLTVYLGLKEMITERGSKYIVAIKGKEKWWGFKGFEGDVKFVDALPKGAIVTFEYRTGSHSKAYHTYAAAFLVSEMEGDVTLEDMTDGEDVVVRVKGLRRLQPASEEDIARINALFANKYGAKPSKYEPVSFFYHVWVEKGLAQPPKPAPPPPPQPVEEGEPFELSISAPAAPAPAPVAAPAPAVSTAVETVTTPAPAPVAKAPPTPEAETPQALVEEAMVELQKILAERGYTMVKIASFDLPSEYKGVSVEQVEEEGRIVERRRLIHDAKTLSQIRGLRRKFYTILSSCAFRTPLGWVIMVEELPKELIETVERLQKLAGGEWTVLELPIPQLWVREQAERARDRLAASLEEVSKTLADEAISNTLRRRLERRKKEIEAALSRLSLFLSALR
ncbi:MAG: hypothetical protein QW230_05100 [Thermofilum sp.]